MNPSQQIAESANAHLIAPAGCGKTHLIAEAVAKHNSGRELVLTHTHAGVDSVRRKLKKLGARTATVHVDTIAGWALTYVSAFPATTGMGAEATTNPDWSKVYKAATSLVSRSAIAKVLLASYSGVYVDEYQDCTVEQHELIRVLSQLIPCRLLGDPLQGIFEFKNNPVIDWDLHVAGEFPALPSLSTPWRWKDTCPELGTWLITVRRLIESGNPIDLKQAPQSAVRWVRLPDDKTYQSNTQRDVCHRAPTDGGTILAVLQWENQCNNLVRSLAPMFHNIETIECDDLKTFAVGVDSSAGVDRLSLLEQFGMECFSGFQAEMKTVFIAARKGEWVKTRPLKHQRVLDALRVALGDGTSSSICLFLESLTAVDAIKLWRKELFNAMRQALREHSAGDVQTLAEAVSLTRNRTRHIGRRLPLRVISRTLLVKGLEFDHCLILDADALRSKDLYVAMTRPMKSLTILSRERVLRPVR